MGSTCYANACASGIRACESRILGRKLQSHEDIVKKIVLKYGNDGGDPLTVLLDECY